SSWVHELARPIRHFERELAVLAERSVLKALQGTCTTPLAVHARLVGERLELMAWVGAPDGSAAVRIHEEIALKNATQEEVEQGAIRFADRLLAQGAERILQEARTIEDPYSFY
ncbi:MAG: hypothetical protein N2515_11110, partial [Deltaproteobacteria bacterium]|nr:hypothetical protein [Deltaproteobacteria bacterium]